MERSTSRPGSLLGLFALGAMVGAVAALLMAPESGDDSRKRISVWMHEHNPHFFEKLKKMLTMKHNGIHHAVNGHASAARRHKRGA